MVLADPKSVIAEALSMLGLFYHFVIEALVRAQRVVELDARGRVARVNRTGVLSHLATNWV